MLNCSPEHIRQLKQGNRLVQKQTFEAMYAYMFRVCNRYIIQQDEAEDCLMKGFLKGFQQIEKFEYVNDESFLWWLRRIMVNECLMALRKNHNFIMSIETEIADVSIDAGVFQKMHAEDLNSLIMKLPTGYRTVFSLHVIEGYEHKEIATMLSISENTSKTQLAKAKSKLRQLLTQINYPYESTGR